MSLGMLCFNKRDAQRFDAAEWFRRDTSTNRHSIPFSMGILASEKNSVTLLRLFPMGEEYSIGLYSKTTWQQLECGVELPPSFFETSFK